MENEILLQDFASIADSNLPFEEYNNKTFLITGATGLIGSLLVKTLRYLNEKRSINARILAVVRSKEKAKTILGEENEELSYVICDLAKDELLLEEACDYVIHAAAVTTSKVMVSDPVGTIRTAIDGTEKLLKLAVEKKVKAFVYVSSMEIYGQPVTEGKTKEKDLGYVDIGAVRSCYPEGKRMCECLCTAYASQYGVNVMSARLAQTFGAGILPTENRVFAQFARSAMKKEDIVLHTTGESEGNYVYTSDAIRAILLLLVKGQKGEAYNIANEESHITIRDMAEMVAGEIAEHRIQVVIDIPSDSSSLGYAPPVRMWLDSSKMMALGWEPKVGLKEAYQRMIAFMQ